jgi:hypothetical protein
MACKSPAAEARHRIASPSSRYKGVSFDNITNVASAGTVIVDAIAVEAADLKKSTVISAEFTPSMLDTTIAFTLKTLLEPALFVTIAVADVPTDWTAVLPIIVATLTMLGAAIYYFLLSKYYCHSNSLTCCYSA